MKGSEGASYQNQIILLDQDQIVHTVGNDVLIKAGTECLWR